MYGGTHSELLHLMGRGTERERGGGEGGGRRGGGGEGGRRRGGDEMKGQGEEEKLPMHALYYVHNDMHVYMCTVHCTRS